MMAKTRRRLGRAIRKRRSAYGEAAKSYRARRPNAICRSAAWRIWSAPPCCDFAWTVGILKAADCPR